MSNQAQEAREALGARLRGFRKDAGFASGRAVSGWASKGIDLDMVERWDKTSEKRELGLGRAGFWRKYSSQAVVFNDAESTHLNIRVADTNVELKPEATQLYDEKNNLIEGAPDFQRATPELLTLNNADDKRPQHVVIKLPLQASRPASVSRLVIFVLTATALYMEQGAATTRLTIRAYRDHGSKNGMTCEPSQASNKLGCATVMLPTAKE